MLLAAGCGLRLGELLALTRADVDLVHGKLHVDKQKQELSNGQGIVIRPPKTEAGKRPVNIPTIIVGELEEHLREFVGAAPEAALFLGPRGGQRRARVYEEWHKAVTAAGLRPDLKPHDLRHLHNTLAAKVPGITLKDLMAQMGHKSEEAAIRYLHASDDAGLAIAADLDRTLRAADAGRMPDVRSFRSTEEDGLGL